MTARLLRHVGILLAVLSAAGVGRTAGASPRAVERQAGAMCVGDCGGDGAVTVDEVLRMVNIALGNLPVTACANGDVNGDGAITINEILQAVGNALFACPTAIPTDTPTATVSATPTSTPTASPTETPTALPTATVPPAIVVGSVSGAVGAAVGIDVTLVGGAGRIVSASTDIVYDSTQVSVGLTAAGQPDCILNPDIGPGSAADKRLLLSQPGASPEAAVLRIGIFNVNTNAIPDGLLVICSFNIAAGATPGDHVLTAIAGAADANSDSVEVQSVNGRITVQ